MTLKITPLGKHAGAEATGVDLSKPIHAETGARLRAALVEHVALVVRDQKLDADGFVAAVRAAFAEPVPQNFTTERLDKDGFVGVVTNALLSKAGERVYHSAYWHTDHTNREVPPSFTALYAVELPKSGGGDTGVVNTRAAYAALAPELRQKIEGLKTVNVFQGSASKKRSFRNEVKTKAIDDKPVVHPLIRTVPETGGQAIYIHQGKVENFVGMSPEASHELIGELIEQAVKPEFVYRHKWRLGDLFIWDDRASMHQAYTDYDLQENRVLYRIVAGAERPV